MLHHVASSFIIHESSCNGVLDHDDVRKSKSSVRIARNAKRLFDFYTRNLLGKTNTILTRCGVHLGILQEYYRHLSSLQHFLVVSTKAECEDQGNKEAIQ